MSVRLLVHGTCGSRHCVNSHSFTCMRHDHRVFRASNLQPRTPHRVHHHPQASHTASYSIPQCPKRKWTHCSCKCTALRLVMTSFWAPATFRVSFSSAKQSQCYNTLIIYIGVLAQHSDDVSDSRQSSRRHYPSTAALALAGHTRHCIVAQPALW